MRPFSYNVTIVHVPAEGPVTVTGRPAEIPPSGLPLSGCVGAGAGKREKSGSGCPDTDPIIAPAAGYPYYKKILGRKP